MGGRRLSHGAARHPEVAVGPEAEA
jgi:hypothetical protein